jgi:predicted DNA-binding protein (MmcQ/YjbR family)
MTREELIDHCLTYPSVYKDYPFGDDTATIRHSGNRKLFALFISRKGRELVNLKCDPLAADFLRQTFAGVTPGWHMNKEHWNTVIIGADVPDEEILRQIENSYDLTKPKPRGRKQPAGLEK